MIKWSKQYEIGIETIDVHHKWLFDFANSLEDQLIKDHQRADIDKSLRSMEEYANRHFNEEDECMFKWQCPVAHKNKDAHANFIWAYENFMERYNREGHSEDLAWKIHNMVEHWIIDHICHIDTHLKDCALASDTKLNPLN